MEKRKISRCGANGDGRRWSAELELPFFNGRGPDGFYTELAERICARAKSEGVNASSYLTVTEDGDGVYSLYVDIVFYRGREAITVLRLCDTRRNGRYVPMPRALKRRGYDCFCLRGERTVAFRRVMPDSPMRMRDRVRCYSEELSEIRA